ncbi:hypothetical protein HNS38_10895 [Lentimicrobium sp. L6]|uniref:hypothetical protein n=1 Tax=Lentimicrobium sp. L6 TaxID=2735916 RepID=UPI0015547F16|nr:hypothetical protein [Lentimicrobium sp. L6]NPD85270.1 hypothetical protein [Lentimicrobium sp. L6]
MMKISSILKSFFLISLLAVFTLQTNAQSSAKSQRDAQISKSIGHGALIGGLSGLVFGRGFGGVVGGAMIGAGIGAVAGAVNGSSDNPQLQSEVDFLIDKYGESNMLGYVDLMECKHDEAITHFIEQEFSNNKDYKVASLWMKAITEKDRGNTERCNELYQLIANNDSRFETPQDAEIQVIELYIGLMADRESYEIVCGE